MRRVPLFLLTLLLVGLAVSAAHAQGAGQNGYQTDWATLDPGDDWSAQVLRSLFPVTTGAALPGIGAENTVIGTMLGQLTGFLLALAAVFVGYMTMVHIHRAAESGRVLSNTVSSWAPVRLCLAIALMFPLPSGFSSGQWAVMKVSLWGIGMARSVYTAAIKAVGPDAMPIAQPMIPGTKSIVAGLIQNELCRALVNQASGNANLVPIPNGIRSYAGGTAATSGAFVNWPYALSDGNSIDAPTCGSVTIRQPNPNATNYAGVSVDMAGAQLTALTNVVSTDIRPDVEAAAAQFWQTRKASSLTPLLGTMIRATQDYTQQLTQTATTFTASMRAALANADAARAGALGLAQNQDRLAALGWTGAGAYYVEIARLNGQTLSLLSAVPTVQAPSYRGLGWSLGSDLAPLISSALAFQQKIKEYVDTTDGLDAPGGNSELFSGATPGEAGASTIDQVVRSLHLNERVLNAIVGTISTTTGSGWTDPFAALINLGQTLILISLSALGLAAVLASTTATAGVMAWNVLTLNFSAAAAAVGGHLVMSFLGTPIFYGLMALLIPGLLIAYVLPMIPFAMWIAGVVGWLILVIEAMIAVPLWMFAHLTFDGDGLHGRGLEGYALLFNVLFRPVLLLFGLFTGYFVFSSSSWLLLQGFGIAAGFALSSGWFVTNLLGLIVLTSMFVLMEITLALLSFRMISLVPHHVVKLIGFQPANRTDIDRFSQDVGMVGTGATLTTISGGLREGVDTARQLGASQQEVLGNGAGNSASGRATGPQRLLGNDSTLNAQSDVTPPAKEED